MRSLVRSRSRDGVALVLVLAFILLTSILILSFIAFSSSNHSSTASYAKAIQAQEIAQGGLQDILNDLHQEIVAGSSAYVVGSSTVYIPTTNYTAQPTRLGYSSSLYTNDVSSAFLPPTLVRVSRASQDGTPTDLYPPMTNAYFTTASVPANRASPSHSSSASINGRSVSSTRWNKIALLTTNSIIPPPFATNTPDWIYVTRSGSLPVGTNNLNSTTASILPSNNLTSTNQVIGRYAYAVYDEGALIDINVAGYISAAGNASLGYATNASAIPVTNNFAGITEKISSKSYLAYADLTQLPGLTNSQSTVDALIKWRNASVDMSTASTAATNYFRSVYGNVTNGFLIGSSSSTGTDSPLLGRQDLIKYFAKIDPNSTSAARALPYLSTFTRALTAPSWGPSSDATGLPGYYGTSGFGNTNGYFNEVPYKAQAETTGSVNRDLPNVRYTKSFNITHYNDDGTIAQYADSSGTLQNYYTVQAGDPLLQHRFSLAKLSWLTYNGVAPATFPPSVDVAAAIKACFGLAWDSAGYRWDYVAGSTSPVGIKTLDVVASEGREPNFFELLKAGILSGSLGQSPGYYNDGTSSSNYEGVQSYNMETYSAEKNLHILQIGANIIDQFDSDSYPTAIYLACFSPANIGAVDDLCVNTVYGDENLPSITRVNSDVVVDPVDTSTSPQTPYIKFWLQPEVWNIHQPPKVTPTKVPTNFRLHTYGKVHYVYTSSSATVPTTPLGSIDFDDYTTTLTYHGPGIASTTATTTGGTSGLIVMTDPDSGTAASPFYNRPLRLKSGIGSVAYSTFTQALNLFNTKYYTGMPLDYSATTQSGSPLKYVTGGTNNGISFVAFFAGEGTFPDCTTGAGSTGTSPRSGFLDFHCDVDRALYFSIEYLDPATSLTNSPIWRPYGFISRIATQGAGQTTGILNYNYGNTLTGGAMIGQTDISNGGWLFSRPDPRTGRMGSMEAQATSGRWVEDSSIDPGRTLAQNAPQGIENYFPTRAFGYVYYPTLATPTPWFQNEYIGYWTQNNPSNTIKNSFYVDPDGVVRPGDSYHRNSTTMYTSSDSGDGSTTYHGDAVTSPASTMPSISHAIYTDPTGSAQARRPVILNRPFRSVGELGYAFRDVPFKTLDFFSPYSADAGLLDLFSTTDEPNLTAGVINPSNAPAAALAAVFTGSAKMEINSPTSVNNIMTAADSLTAAQAATTQLNQQGPLRSRAEIATRLCDPIFNALYTASVAGSMNYANKTYLEGVTRALAPVANTRTWNLLIDIIAQAGQMSPAAKTLDDFVVQGERRYWLHVAIDRYTGKVVDQQLEPVYDN